VPLRIAGLPVLTPSDLAGAVRSVLGWTDEAVQVVSDLPQRVSDLVDTAEELVGRVDALLRRVEAVVERVDGVAADARTLVARAGTVADGADAVVGRADAVAAGAGEVVERAGSVADGARGVLDSAGATAAGAQELLDLYGPVAQRGAPLLTRFVSEFSDRELEALIRLVDHVPVFTERMEADIMPVLAKLDQVGPDVHELLDVLKDVRLAIQGVPGFALFRRRGAEKEEELVDGRPETEPPVDRR
jgi:hypothetical protein